MKCPAERQISLPAPHRDTGTPEGIRETEIHVPHNKSAWDAPKQRLKRRGLELR